MHEPTFACPECNYSLAGLHSFRCPECGREGSPEQYAQVRCLLRSARWAIPLHLLLPIVPVVIIGSWVHGPLRIGNAEGYVFAILLVGSQLLAGHLSCLGLPPSARLLWRVSWVRLAPLLQLSLLMPVALAWLGHSSLRYSRHGFAPADVDHTFIAAAAIWITLGIALAVVSVFLWRRLTAPFAPRHTPRRVVLGLTLSILFTIIGGLPPIAVTWLIIIATAFT